MGALTGLKVLDLSRVLAGPWSSQLLADLGADACRERIAERTVGPIGDEMAAGARPFIPGREIRARRRP